MLHTSVIWDLLFNVAICQHAKELNGESYFCFPRLQVTHHASVEVGSLADRGVVAHTLADRGVVARTLADRGVVAHTLADQGAAARTLLK